MSEVQDVHAHLCEAVVQFARANVLAEVVKAFRLGHDHSTPKTKGLLWVMCSVFSWLAPLLSSTKSSRASYTSVSMCTFNEGQGRSVSLMLSRQTLTSMDAEATILSIYGIGAYDLSSRSPMFRGVKDMVEGDEMIPFLRQFYGSPSMFLSVDDMGTVRRVSQGEGGEQGDPFKTLLFSLDQYSTVVVVKSS